MKLNSKDNGISNIYELHKLVPFLEMNEKRLEMLRPLGEHLVKYFENMDVHSFREENYNDFFKGKDTSDISINTF
jgi:hypothetical protein